MKRREIDWRLWLVEDAGGLSRRLEHGGVAMRLSRRSGFSGVFVCITEVNSICF
jgi:hypothetical protein